MTRSNTRVLWEPSLRRDALLGATALCLAEAATLAVPWLLKAVFDLAEDAPETSDAITARLVACGLAFVAANLLAWRARLRFDALHIDAANHLRKQAFERLLKKPAQWHAATTVGERLARGVSDADLVGATIGRAIPALITVGIGTFGSIAALAFIAPVLLPLTLAPLPLIGLAWLLYRRRVPAQAQRSLVARDRLYAESVAALNATDTIAVYDAADDIAKRYARISDACADASRSVANLASSAGPLANILVSVAVITALGVGVKAVASGALTIGALMAYYLYATRSLIPARQAPAVVVMVKQARPAWRRLKALLQEPPQEREPIDAPTNAAVTAGAHVVLHDLSFEYDDTNATEDKACDHASMKILRGLDLELAPNARVAILGPSGAGKSTLGRVVCGILEPSAGRITIDGHDAAAGRTMLRGSTGYVEQEPPFFSMTYAENLTLGIADADNGHTEAAARMACFDRVLTRKNQALDDEVGADGVQLSGGERKRFALARAIARSPRILVIDQMASDLEEAINQEIFSALDALPATTILYLGHRLPKGMAFDRVLWMEHGTLRPRAT